MFGFYRELMRQIMLAQRDFDFHAGVAIVAQHFDHARHRLAVARRLFDQINADHLPRPGVGTLVRRHQKFLADAFVLGHHHPHTVTILQASDMARARAFEYLRDLAFGASTTVYTRDARHHAVTVQHLAHFVGTQKNIRSLVITYQKAKAIFVAQYAAGNQIQFFNHADGVTPVAHQFAFALHRGETLGEGAAFVFGDIQQRA